MINVVSVRSFVRRQPYVPYDIAQQVTVPGILVLVTNFVCSGLFVVSVRDNPVHD